MFRYLDNLSYLCLIFLSYMTSFANLIIFFINIICILYNHDLLLLMIYLALIDSTVQNKAHLDSVIKLYDNCNGFAC